MTLVRGERGWTVKERGDYPADVEPIRDLLLKLQELKVVQAEGLSDAVKPRLQLAAPDAGAKPEETGTLVDLKGRDGKIGGETRAGEEDAQGHEDPRPPGRRSERALRLGRGRPAAGQRRQRVVRQRRREARAVAVEGAHAVRAAEVDHDLRAGRQGEVGGVEGQGGRGVEARRPGAARPAEGVRRVERALLAAGRGCRPRRERRGRRPRQADDGPGGRPSRAGPTSCRSASPRPTTATTSAPT